MTSLSTQILGILAYLGLTLVVRALSEAALVERLLGSFDDRRKLRQIAVRGVLVTHVFSALFFVVAARQEWWGALVLSPLVEVVAALVKWALYARLRGRRPILPAFFTACFATAGSFALGLGVTFLVIYVLSIIGA